jgi:hypothetical protein
VRGLFRYEAAAGHWWACAEAADGGRVHIERIRYERMEIEPPFLELPIEGAGQSAKPQRAGLKA